MTRPNPNDIDALDLLMSDDRLDTKNAQFIEDLAMKLAEDVAEERETIWTPAQCEYFDDLTARYL